MDEQKSQLDIAPRLAGLDGTPSAAAAVSTQFITLGTVIGYDQLLRDLGKVVDEDPADLLREQFLHLYQQAKARAGVEPIRFMHDGGQGHAITRTAEEAERLAEATMNVIVESNTKIVDEQFWKKLAMGIVPVRIADSGERDLQVSFLAQAMGNVTALIRDAGNNEIRLAEHVYQALPEARRAAYVSAECSGGGKPAKFWRQIFGPRLDDTATDRCVMVIDMARSSHILECMIQIIGDREQAATIWQNQVMAIISGGFTNSGVGPMDKFLYKFGGDGGIFLLPTALAAHKVAIAILKLSEEQNRKGREIKNEQMMRCFRIGIDTGRLTRDDNGEFSGEPFVVATRLESGGPSGEIRASASAYRQLPDDIRQFYGDEEIVLGKDHDRGIAAHRYPVVPRALWPELAKNGEQFPPPKFPNKEFPTPVQLERCFVLSPIPTGADRAKKVFDDLITRACTMAGLEPSRADQLPGNRNEIIAENLQNAPLVIAYLGRPSPGWNTNVVLEVGYRLATGLPLVILSDVDDQGQVPDYQRLLPFQILNYNVVTIGVNPTDAVAALTNELIEARSTKHSSTWDNPYPILEFKFKHMKDSSITYANTAAQALFGNENVRPGISSERLRLSLTDRIERSQLDARTAEFTSMVTQLWVHSRGLPGTSDRCEIPIARIPMVFRDTAPAGPTGKPRGYLPVVLRWMFEGDVICIRYLYLPVCAAMRRDDGLNCWVCDI